MTHLTLKPSLRPVQPVAVLLYAQIEIFRFFSRLTNKFHARRRWILQHTVIRKHRVHFMVQWVFPQQCICKAYAQGVSTCASPGRGEYMSVCAALTLCSALPPDCIRINCTASKWSSISPNSSPPLPQYVCVCVSIVESAFNVSN